MSFVSDIIQFFGPTSVPVIVAGTALGVFELGDKFASQRAKDALSKWLLTFDVRKAEALPDGTKELFDQIFGERHLSWKCFIRSVVFSLGAMAFISIVRLLINPHPSQVFSIGWANDLIFSAFDLLFASIIFALWVPWSIVIDYISLFKTRFVLGLLLRMHRWTSPITMAILVMDFIAYKLIFVVGISLVSIVPVVLFFGGNWKLVSFENIFTAFTAFDFIGLYFILFFCWICSIRLVVALRGSFVCNSPPSPEQADCQLASLGTRC